MPHDSIPKSWIESTLRAGEVEVWVELVKKENLDIFAASKALDTWLGADRIAGGPISGKKTLGVEARALATVYEIEEVQDSEDEASEDKASKVAISLRSPRSARLRRQITLLELFNPVN
jgi:hypothetical protein